jgi:hypothetical protein
MITDQLVLDVLNAVPEDWVDTPEQAQLRACLINILSGHDEVTTLAITFALITVTRDQLMTSMATIRRQACRQARDDMTPKEIALATKQSVATISRLLNEARDV